MARLSLWHAPFDRKAGPFVATKPLRHGERLIGVGEELPATDFTDRRLRQLYEGQEIAPARAYEVERERGRVL